MRAILLALALCAGAPSTPAAQAVAPSRMQADDAPGFKEFADRVQAYLKIQKSVDATLPPLKSTDLPEMITAHQQALARKIREARPQAKTGNLFTTAAREAFRRASQVALGGTHTAASLAYMQPGAPDPDMHVEVNGTYPDAAPITALSPALLAAFPVLPIELAYRIVGRTLIVVDVKSRLIVDLARLVLPPAS